MTTLQKTIVTATIAVLAGAGVYYSHQRLSDKLPSNKTATVLSNTNLNSEHLTATNPEVQKLLANLNSPDTETRLHAIQAIENLGPNGVEAVPALIRLLDDKERNIRTLAAHALGKIGPDAKMALPALRKLAQSSKLFRSAEQSMAAGAIKKIEKQ